MPALQKAESSPYFRKRTDSQGPFDFGLIFKEDGELVQSASQVWSFGFFTPGAPVDFEVFVVRAPFSPTPGPNRVPAKWRLMVRSSDLNLATGEEAFVTVMFSPFPRIWETP